MQNNTFFCLMYHNETPCVSFCTFSQARPCKHNDSDNIKKSLEKQVFATTSDVKKNFSDFLARKLRAMMRCKTHKKILKIESVTNADGNILVSGCADFLIG